jgi:CheY-like chemotaxis protein
LHKPLILIVEDSAADQYLIKRALSKFHVDADIEVAEDGQIAVDIFDQIDADSSRRCPDLVLLDLNLPRVNGLEVLQHMRSVPRCSQSRIVMVTSSDLPNEREFMEQWKADGYFQKVADKDEFMKLGELVGQVLGDPARPEAPM